MIGAAGGLAWRNTVTGSSWASSLSVPPSSPDPSPRVTAMSLGSRPGGLEGDCWRGGSRRVSRQATGLGWKVLARTRVRKASLFWRPFAVSVLNIFAPNSTYKVAYTIKCLIQCSCLSLVVTPALIFLGMAITGVVHGRLKAEPGRPWTTFRDQPVKFVPVVPRYLVIRSLFALASVLVAPGQVARSVSSSQTRSHFRRATRAIPRSVDRSFGLPLFMSAHPWQA